MERQDSNSGLALSNCMTLDKTLASFMTIEIIIIFTLELMENEMRLWLECLTHDTSIVVFIITIVILILLIYYLSSNLIQ